MNILTDKRCYGCGKWKNKKEFGKNKRNKDGIHSQCKKCHNNDAYKWKNANIEKVRKVNRESNHKLYIANPQKYHEWRRANSEKVSEYNHQYYSINKEKFAEKTANRRAKCNGGIVTAEQWETLKRKYNYTCLRCKKREPEIALTRDHVLPLEFGGLHVIENIQPLCKSCNSWKHTKHIDYR